MTKEEQRKQDNFLAFMSGWLWSFVVTSLIWAVIVGLIIRSFKHI